MVEKLPEGQLGLAKLTHVEVSEQAASFSRVRAVVTGGREQPINAGTYAQLHVGSVLMMSDTQMERRSNYEVVRKARGHVFIAGLGLGMILHPILTKEEVTQVTVVEKYGDVIQLVSPTLPNQEKLQIIEADVLDWKPAKGTRFDTIYFDIWPDIVEENLDDMAVLHRRFAHFKQPGGWMNSWNKELLTLRYRRR